MNDRTEIGERQTSTSALADERERDELELGDERGTDAPDPAGNGDASMISRPPSNLDRLREQYAATGEDDREIIPIAPGRFDGNLAGRYRRIDWNKRRKEFRRAQKRGGSSEAELNYGAKIIVEALDEILVRLEDGGDFVSLADTEVGAGEPVKYDRRLAEILGIELPAGAISEVSICRLVFKHPDALDDHFSRLEMWLRELSETDEDGEGGERPT